MQVCERVLFTPHVIHENWKMVTATAFVIAIFVHTILSFQFPSRKDPNMTGTLFASQIMSLGPGKERDTAILTQILSGNFPDFLRAPIPLQSNYKNYTATLYVLSDYFSIGTNEDFFRIPLTPLVAQRVCDIFGCTFTTRYLVNLIWKESKMRLAPLPWGPPYDQTMLSSSRFFEHHKRIEVQRKSQNKTMINNLLVGHKKDIVLTPLLAQRQYSSNVVIYGWTQLNGVPIQQLNPKSHDNHYADYSHGARFVSLNMIVNGISASFSDILSRVETCGLVSDEGPSNIWKQPSN